MIGQTIKDRRMMLGLSQIDFARKVGVSQQFLSRMETGQRGISIDNLLAFARVLDCHPADLLDVPPNLPASDLDLLRAIRALPASQRQLIEAFILDGETDEPRLTA